jgi:hypothetical protein
MFDSTGMTTEIAESYNSLSGSDIRAMIGPYQFAQLQSISYSISREKAPVYCLGSPDPRSFSRNKRGIAGSLVWVNFDRNALLDVFRRAQNKFIANRDDLRPAYADQAYGPLQDSTIFSARANRGTSNLPVGATIDQLNTQTFTKVSGWKQRSNVWMADQALPFDITVMGINEIGASATLKLLGVEILNEGSGISIDDTVSESQCTFVARLIEPWQAVVTEFSPA